MKTGVKARKGRERESGESLRARMYRKNAANSRGSAAEMASQKVLSGAAAGRKISARTIQGAMDRIRTTPIR
jgi:hypothetical protein